MASTKDVKAGRATGVKGRAGKAAEPPAPPALPGTWTMSVFAVVAAVWAGMQLEGMRNLLRLVVVDDPTGVVQLVLYVDAIIIGAVFAGIVAGLFALRLTEPGRFLAGQPRYVVGAIGGLLAGIVVGGLAYWIFAEKAGVAALVAAAIGVTAVVGGLLSAMRPTIMIAAGLLGLIALTAVWFVRGLSTVQDGILDLFDFGDGVVGKINAYGWYGLSTALFAGVLIGIVVHLYLRRRGGRLPLFAHLFAGALPGLVWLLAELTVWAIGNPLLSFAGELSFIDETSISTASQSQFNGALAVLFAGAMTALLAVGLLAPKPPARAGREPRTVPAARKGAEKGGTGRTAGTRPGASRRERRSEDDAPEDGAEGKPTAKPADKPANPGPSRARPAPKGRTTQGRGRPGSRP